MEYPKNSKHPLIIISQIKIKLNMFSVLDLSTVLRICTIMAKTFTIQHRGIKLTSSDC